jgi:hypothetical protein
LSDAEAETVTAEPDTVALWTGAVSETVGGCVSVGAVLKAVLE